MPSLPLPHCSSSPEALTKSPAKTPRVVGSSLKMVVTSFRYVASGSRMYSVQPSTFWSLSLAAAGKSSPTPSMIVEGFTKSRRSSGPQVRTIAAPPSLPSFTISSVVALMTVSMLIAGCISRKLSRPGWPTSSTSMRFPPKAPTLYMSRTPGFWMMKRASPFSIMVSPSCPLASGPVMSSAPLVISCADAKPTQESLATASSKASQSKPSPVAPLSARQKWQRVALTAHADSWAGVVAADGKHLPWNIPINGSVVAPHVLAIALVSASVLFAILPFASAARAVVIAVCSAAADVTAGPLLPASALFAAPCISFQRVSYSLPAFCTVPGWHASPALSL